MINNELYNPISRSFRSEIGGAEVAAPLWFRVRIPKSERAEGVHLVITGEGRAAFNVYMEKTGEEENFDLFFTRFTPVEKGLYWYFFSYWNGEKTCYIAKSRLGFGIISDVKTPFQLTVCERGVEQSDEVCGGVMYQILPDRFNRAGEIRVRKGGIYHENWEDVPNYLPNALGEITNDDFFGGNFEGVIEKLNYLQSLKVDMIYFNPVFEAQSNHRYDTGDFEKIDDNLGGEEKFAALLSECKTRGIKVILDGVFNHVGMDSKYFNKSGLYDTVGAYQSKESPYYEWFSFKHYPDSYRAWWDVALLPAISENCPSYEDYIVKVVDKYMEMGVAGFRLDVVDELPDEFLAKLVSEVKRFGEDKIVIGEVWEDASNKIAYGRRRKYFTENRLDSVMNYPWQKGIIEFIRTGKNEELYFELVEIYNNYPKRVSDALMNILSTHDSVRAITALGGKSGEGKTRAELAKIKLTKTEYERGKERLMAAALLQFTLPGFPCVYYGDEAGLVGYNDPFNRMTYPWGREDEELIEWYEKLAALREKYGVFCKGDFELLPYTGGVLAFSRKKGEDKLTVVVNRSDEDYAIRGTDILSGKRVECVSPQKVAVII